VFTALADLLALAEGDTFNMSAEFVCRKRHIGIHHGRHNFPLVTLAKEVNQVPVVTAATKNNFDLGQQFTASNVFVKLQQATGIWSWMQ